MHKMENSHIRPFQVRDLPLMILVVNVCAEYTFCPIWNVLIIFYKNIGQTQEVGRVHNWYFSTQKVGDEVYKILVGSIILYFMAWNTTAKLMQNKSEQGSGPQA